MPSAASSLVLPPSYLALQFSRQLAHCCCPALCSNLAKALSLLSILSALLLPARFLRDKCAFSLGRDTVPVPPVACSQCGWGTAGVRAHIRTQFGDHVWYVGVCCIRHVRGEEARRLAGALPGQPALNPACSCSCAAQGRQHQTCVHPASHGGTASAAQLAARRAQAMVAGGGSLTSDVRHTMTAGVPPGGGVRWLRGAVEPEPAAEPGRLLPAGQDRHHAGHYCDRVRFLRQARPRARSWLPWPCCAWA